MYDDAGLWRGSKDHSLFLCRLLVRMLLLSCARRGQEKCSQTTDGDIRGDICEQSHWFSFKREEIRKRWTEGLRVNGKLTKGVRLPLRTRYGTLTGRLKLCAGPEQQAHVLPWYRMRIAGEIGQASTVKYLIVPSGLRKKRKKRMKRLTRGRQGV